MPPGAKPKPPGTAKRPEQQRHQWQHAAGTGWQHGKTPPPPQGLTDRGRRAWRMWLRSWWAAFYTPDDLPALELLVHWYDAAYAGDDKAAGRFLSAADKLGITPKGRQDLRWAPPVAEPAPSAVDDVADEIARRRAERNAKLA